MTQPNAPGLCAEHGGLMWSNAMRACITPDDVIRGGCQWRPLDPEAIGLTVYGEVMWDDEQECDVVLDPIDVTPGAALYVDKVWVSDD